MTDAIAITNIVLDYIEKKQLIFYLPFPPELSEHQGCVIRAGSPCLIHKQEHHIQNHQWRNVSCFFLVTSKARKQKKELGVINFREYVHIPSRHFFSDLICLGDAVSTHWLDVAGFSCLVLRCIPSQQRHKKPTKQKTTNCFLLPQYWNAWLIKPPNLCFLLFENKASVRRVGKKKKDLRRLVCTPTDNQPSRFLSVRHVQNVLRLGQCVRIDPCLP